MAEAGLCRKLVVLDETPWHDWPAGNFNSPETLPLVAQLGQGLFSVRIRGDAKHAAALLFVADIVGILILLLEERIVAGFDFDIVIRHDRTLVVANIGFNEQIQHGFCARWRLAVIDHCRCAKSTFRLEA